MRVDGRAHLGRACLEIGKEPHQPADVIALGKALARHESARFERCVREQEAVGRHEVDARVVGPARQQGLEDAGDRALADGDASCDADDERHPSVEVSEEGLGHDVELARCGHPQVEQT